MNFESGSVIRETIRDVGGSAYLLLRKAIADYLKIEVDSIVSISLRKGRKGNYITVKKEG